MIPRGNNGVLVGDSYAIYRIVGDIATKLGKDIDNILYEDSGRSPSGFLKSSFSKSASSRVYYAPRNPKDGFPPRQYTLRDVDNYSISVSSKISSMGFTIHDELSLTQGYRHRHKSLFGSTRGQEVYPWIWIDEGRTYKNRFTSNPRNINQTFTREWHSQGYRDIFINKVGSRLKKKGWDVV